MKPFPVDLPIIWRGSGYDTIYFYWKDVSGANFNLTGWQFFAQTDQFDLNGVISAPANGITIIGLNNTQTAALNLGVFNWNCWFRDPNGRVTPPLLAGKVPIRDRNTIV